MSQVSSLAGFVVKAAVAAVAVSVGVGQAFASSASPDTGASPVSAARPAAAAQPGATAQRQPIRVGSVTIPPCKASRLAWCTRINVPLDYRDPAAGHIKLGFQWYPATSGTAVGTILAVQGGPGFPTTDYAADYRGTFQPLLARRNLLLVNLRGTGNSSAFLCKPLQNWETADGIAAYTIDTGKCGWQLNHTRKLNDTHVNAMDDPVGCASGLVQTFIKDPAGLKQMDASCATRTPEVRVVGTFPTTLSRVTPATARPGDQTGRTGLRLAAVGAAAVGDAVWRWYYGDGVKGWGLRGGTFRFTGDGSRIGIRLTRVRWTSDTRVSGTVRWNQVSGRVQARLTIAGPAGISASVRLRYFDYVRHSKATLSGRYRDQRIAATMPAP